MVNIHSTFIAAKDPKTIVLLDSGLIFGNVERSCSYRLGLLLFFFLGHLNVIFGSGGIGVVVFTIVSAYVDVLIVQVKLALLYALAHPIAVLLVVLDAELLQSYYFVKNLKKLVFLQKK